MCRYAKFNKEGQVVRCSRCDECYKFRAMEWYVRLYYELRHARTAYFVTLTYDNTRVPYTKSGLMTVHKKHLQGYFKRLRKREKGNTLIKYYAASEYGKKGESYRPHYHVILLNVQDERNIHRAWSVTDTKTGEMFYYGNVFVPPYGGVADASIKYVTGYIGKRLGIPKFKGDDRVKEFSLMSKNLGKAFLSNAEYFRRNEFGHIVVEGCTYPMPRYFKERLYPDTVHKTAAQNWVDYAKYWRERYNNDALWKAHMKRMGVQHFKPTKEKHPTLSKISKNNYEKFYQAKINSLANFASYQDWATNRIDLADTHNKSKPFDKRVKPRQG